MSTEPEGESTDQAEAEFDTVATWTVDAVRALGPDHAIPAGCRGSGGLTDEPEANHFPSLDELDHVVAAAGLSTMSSIGLDELPEAPEEWQTNADEVDAWIEHEHSEERAWQAGHESEQAVGHLIESGQVVGHLRTLRPG